MCKNVQPLILQDCGSLFMEKSFVRLLIKAKIFKVTFFFPPLDCLHHGSVSFPTTGRIKGEIHVQYYSFPCSSKINFIFRVSLECTAYGVQGYCLPSTDGEKAGGILPCMLLKKIKMVCNVHI